MTTIQTMLPPAPQLSKLKRAQEERYLAKRAQKHHDVAIYTRDSWLAALADDGLLIGFGQPAPEVFKTLNAAHLGVMFTLYGLVNEKTDQAPAELMLSGLAKMQDLMKAKAAPTEKDRIAIAAVIETARQSLRKFLPIQIIQSAQRMATYRPSLFSSAPPKQEPIRKVLRAPSPHLITFGVAN